MGLTLRGLAAVLRGDDVPNGHRRMAGLILMELGERGIEVQLDDEGHLQLLATREQGIELMQNFASADPDFAEEFRRLNADVLS